MAFNRAVKTINDQIITDLSALTHYDDAACFALVKKLYIDVPSQAPAAQVEPIGESDLVDGIDYTNRGVRFRILVLDHVENSSSYSEAEAKIDRMSDLQDVLNKYLVEIPNNIGTVNGIRIDRVDIEVFERDKMETEMGISLYLLVEFLCNISIDVKNYT